MVEDADHEDQVERRPRVELIDAGGFEVDVFEGNSFPCGFYQAPRVVDSDVVVEPAAQVLRTETRSTADLEHSIEIPVRNSFDRPLEAAAPSRTRARRQVLGAVSVGDGIEELAIRSLVTAVHLSRPPK